jgi:hypothetical protein
MSELLEYFLKQHITAESFQHPEVSVPLLKIKIEGKRPVTLIMTDGLSQKKMKLPEQSIEFDQIELYWALPEYWDLSSLSNPNTNWIFHWLNKLVRHLLDKDAWFGHGHTFQCQPLSSTMKQEYLMLMKPLMVNDVLSKVQEAGKSIGFLSIVPLFKTEFDFKQQKGTSSLVTKMTESGVSEILDDYRESLLKKRFGYLR